MNRLRPEKPKPSQPYRQLWRLVDGAVADCLAHHPDYIAKGVRPRVVRNSITKRVTGTVLSYAEQSAKGRSSASEAADMGSGLICRFLARAVTARLRVWEGQIRTYSRGRAA